MKHDTWTRAQAALLFCGLDPRHSAVSDEGQLQDAHAFTLDGAAINWPAPLPTYPVIVNESVIDYMDRLGRERDRLLGRWQLISQQVEDCLHLLQASSLPERATPQQFLIWAKRKGLASYIFAALGGSLASVLGEFDEPLARPLPAVSPVGGGPFSPEGPPPENYLLTLAALFDPVKVPQLEAMFPANGQWARFAERALRNGLVSARAERGAFNPLLAADWWVHNQGAGPGWDWERCLKVLKRNLPARSSGQLGMFPVYD